MIAITIDSRDEFEKVFPIPKYVIRCGKGYACTEYNAWEGHDFIKKWEGWSAAMLQCKADVTLANEGDIQAGNSPVIPDGYVMVPKEPAEEMLQASYREASVYSPTAYRAMIAAAPQEVKDDVNSLIPLVSRNEQEVK